MIFLVVVQSKHLETHFSNNKTILGTHSSHCVKSSNDHLLISVISEDEENPSVLNTNVSFHY